MKVDEIHSFIIDFQIPPDVPMMENCLEHTIGFGQYIGELVIDAEYKYKKVYADCLENLRCDETETETTRKAKLEAWTAEEKKTLQHLKNLQLHLRAIRMALMQAIKTRREEALNRI